MSMDVCSRIGLSATDNINGHGMCKNTLKSTHGVLKPLSVDELSVDVTSFLNIQDTIEEDSSSSTPTPRNSNEFYKEDLCDKFIPGEIMTQSPRKCLSKDAPPLGKTASHQGVITNESSTHGDTIKSNDPSGFRSISLPTHLKPVSALKGSREKRGATPPVKLTVKWAPDVYDPVPTSVSHVVTNHRSSSKHSKRNSKNKQKHGSKSSRGSKSKDKKQVRKRGGNSCSSSSGMSYKFEHEEEFVDLHEHVHQPGGIDFHVGNPDQLCGSSFMKRYGTSLHISSVAEAT
ncbi:hypothetical protein QVD17_36368 [Tagetes erecta]|uniref:Uncharacterized protein n=1 Tax=Tagetes erecta TaxID=13708 RepID=A0AAD8JSB7_TARER|nr:hypothetical protein QVD17_36368 [Tagetes erecta]